MSNTPFRIPASNQERKAAIDSLSLYDESIDFIEADVALAVASQELCRTRGDLVDFALARGLAPYLQLFLQRRGWLDEDWQKRLEIVHGAFQHQVN